MCGRPRERERAASARHRRVEARHGAGQRPPGQAIRGPLHNLKFSQPELLQTLLPDASSCVLLGRPAETVSVEGQRRIILPEISYISLCHEGPTTAKELQLILWKVFFHKFWYFLKQPVHRYVEGFQSVLRLGFYFPFAFYSDAENNLLQLTASNVVYLVIPVIGLLAWDGPINFRYFCYQFQTLLGSILCCLWKGFLKGTVAHF